MIAINKEGIFIDGVLTTNPELIGLAMLDFQEEIIDHSSDIQLSQGVCDRKTFELHYLDETAFSFNRAKQTFNVQPCGLKK